MANFLTCGRIVGAMLLIFLAPFTKQFYIVYGISGMTDVLDGYIARATNSVSSFGEKLDTIADLCFAVICMMKILPSIALPLYCWIWIGVIIVIKGITIGWGIIIHHKFVAEHTIMNKVTGALLFLFPLTLPFVNINVSGIGICIIATCAAVQELCLIQSEDKSKLLKRK